MTSICEIALTNPSDPEIEALLARSKSVAIVGISDNPDRPSYGVGRYLVESGVTVIPVNPGFREFFGVPTVRSLTEIATQVDIVNIFRKPELITSIVEESIQIGAKAVWMQQGIVNNEAAERARAAGLTVVMDRCIAVELRRLRG